MAWKKIDQSTTRPRNGATPTVHVTWRCEFCRALAVNGGNDPGACYKCPRR